MMLIKDIRRADIGNVNSCMTNKEDKNGNTGKSVGDHLESD